MPEPTYRIAQALHARRAAVGLPKYGQHLTADSPGCMLVHALEESADLTNYLIAEVQRRADAIRKLMAMVSDMEAQGYWPMMHRANAVIDLLGGEAALAKYDEILGGAEDETVAPEPVSTTHKWSNRMSRGNLEFCEVCGIVRRADDKNKPCRGPVAISLRTAPAPRDEALRVATEALQFVADHATNAGGVQMDAEPRYRFLTTGQNELIHTVFSALAAIRGAR